MKFEIPSRFKLGGITINIVYSKDVHVRGDKCSGSADYNKCLIKLLKRGSIPSDKMENTFFHELVHHILNMIEEEDLRTNEQFVSRFATMLHQALVTMEYDQAN